MTRAFLDTSVLIRYFVEDDVPRALAAAELIEGAARLVVSTGVVLETIHVLRTDYGLDNPVLAGLLIRFLSRSNVVVADADKAGLIGALLWRQGASARRLSDAIVVTAAEKADVDFIATFDEKMAAPRVAVRLL